MACRRISSCRAIVLSRKLSTSHLSSDQTKTLWAFLGVALGAVVTLISALLTEQHNRRTDALAREAEERLRLTALQQQALAREAEERLRIDTVAKFFNSSPLKAAATRNEPAWRGL